MSKRWLSDEDANDSSDSDADSKDYIDMLADIVARLDELESLVREYETTLSLTKLSANSSTEQLSNSILSMLPLSLGNTSRETPSSNATQDWEPNQQDSTNGLNSTERTE